MQIEEEQFGKNHLIILVIKFFQANLRKYLDLADSNAVCLNEDYEIEYIEMNEAINSL